MSSEKQEARWVLLAQSGDRDALNELLAGIQHPLYRYILGLTANSAAAEDVLQEVFFRIYKKLRWLREPELFRPWAYRIATREAFKFLKKERRRADQITDEEVLESIPAPEQTEFTSRETMEQLGRLIEQVSPASRAVIILHYLHDMSIEEVAAVLGIAAGTAKSRLAYGLTVLRRLTGERAIREPNGTEKITT